LRSSLNGEGYSVKRFTLPLALLALAAPPADAIADVRFRGKSGQDRLATLRIGDDGLFRRFGIRWRADCRRPGFAFTSSTKMLPPIDSSTPERFVDADRYRARYDNGLRAIFDARGAGERVSARRWRGIFRVRVRVLRGAELLDRCYLRTRWRVVRQG
jgi:hypothetical protein